MLFKNIKYFIKRVSLLALKVLGVSMMGYILLRSLPGSPFEEENMGVLNELQRQSLGLEKSHFFSQFLDWLSHTARGHFYSSYFDRPDVIQAQMFSAFKSTLAMMAVTVSGTLVLSLLFIIAYSKLNSVARRRYDQLNDLALSVPIYVFVGISIVLLSTIHRNFALKVDLPFFILGLIALVLRPTLLVSDIFRKKIELYQTSALDQSLRARGLTRSQIQWRHFGKLALAPTLGSISPWLAQLVMGQLTVEYMLGWNGVGRYFLQSYQSRDFALALSLTVWFCALYFLLDATIEWFREWLDPRLKDQQ